METFWVVFPFNGRIFGHFSTQWKLLGRIFHLMEKFSPGFPLNGNFWEPFSIQWKLGFVPLPPGSPLHVHVINQPWRAELCDAAHSWRYFSFRSQPRPSLKGRDRKASITTRLPETHMRQAPILEMAVLVGHTPVRVIRALLFRLTASPLDLEQLHTIPATSTLR